MTANKETDCKGTEASPGSDIPQAMSQTAASREAVANCEACREALPWYTSNQVRCGRFMPEMLVPTSSPVMPTSEKSVFSRALNSASSITPTPPEPGILLASLTGLFLDLL